MSEILDAKAAAGLDPHAFCEKTPGDEQCDICQLPRDSLVHALPRLKPDDYGRCLRCGGEFPARQLESTGYCRDCQLAENLKSQIDEVLSEMPAHVERFLTRAGLSKRERTAVPDRIPAQLAAALREVECSVSEMRRGRLPSRGFGLSAETGTGKSFALSAMLRQLVHARLSAKAHQAGRAALESLWLRWVSWPELVSRYRVLARREDGQEEVYDALQSLGKVPALVIDDLGAERFTGATYADDWMASQLDLLVDERYNELLPTWYTTNLSPGEFVDRYGSRLYSRLISENPMVRVDGLPDLRMESRSTGGIVAQAANR